MKRSFKLKTSDKKYYWCHIFDTKENMWEWNKNHGYKGKGEYLGIARCYNVYRINPGGRNKLHNEIGCVSLLVSHITSGIVAHEIAHATTFWFHEKYKDYGKLEHPKYNEKFAWELGNLNRQVWVGFYKLGKQGKIKKNKII